MEYYKDGDDLDDDHDHNSFESQHYQVESQFPSSSKVITRASLLAAQKEELQRVMELLSVTENHARILLIHYRWDVEKIFTVFVEKGKDKLYGEACITTEEDINQNLHFLPSSNEILCEICMEEVPRIDTTRMECGHCFCNCCWVEHFIVKINEGQSRRIKCMAYKCNSICEEGKIISLLEAKSPDLAEKFRRNLLESYIEDNKRVKWCPSIPHCGNAIRVENDEYCEVECSCGEQFCFNCAYEAHSPCSCQIWKLWSKKCEDESKTVNWISVNTMFCPKCGKPVEKNGGCNIVRCICGEFFCWLCGQPNGYRPHSCGRFKGEKGTKTNQTKFEFTRYVHYHNRFKAHTDSLKLEARLKERMEAKISSLEEKKRKINCKDFSWVWSGVYRLFRSRRILSYSYPFAYYMFGEVFSDEMTNEELEIKRNLFEDQQQQLEANVEKLSMFLEEPFDKYGNVRVSRTRMNVINLTKLIDDLCKKLYECIDNDLLGPLKTEIHIIAPYRSKGAEKAEGLSENDDDMTDGRSKRYKTSEV